MGFIEEGRQLIQDFVTPEIRSIDARLSAVEKRLESFEGKVEKRFESLESKVDKRFDTIESKMEQNQILILDSLHRIETHSQILVLESLARLESKLQNVA